MKKVTPGHITDAHTEAHHTIGTQAHIAINETLHIEDPHHKEVIQDIPEIVADLDLAYLANKHSA